MLINNSWMDLTHGEKMSVLEYAQWETASIGNQRDKSESKMPEIVNEHLEKLEGYLESESLDVDGRLFVLSEIWDIHIEQQSSHPAR